MIHLSRPAIGDEEIREVEAVLRSGMLASGERVAKFEDATRLRSGVALRRCTLASSRPASGWGTRSSFHR